MHLASAAYAVPETHKISLGYSQLTYSGHPEKVDAQIGSLEYGYNALDRFELKLVARQNETGFRYADAITQQMVVTDLSMTHAGIYFAWHRYTDWLKGNWDINLQYHDLRGNLSDPLLGDVGLSGIGLRYQNYSGSLFADVHYFYSGYETGISVRQWDAGAGWMFVPDQWWVELRQFSIQPDTISKLNAVEVLLKYWPATEWLFWVDSLFFSHSFGDRQLFFDPDAMVLWNNDDVLAQYQRFGASWNLPWHWELLAVYADAQYRIPSPTTEYSSRIGYIQLKKRF